jgi:hypothetical protein
MKIILSMHELYTIIANNAKSRFPEFKDTPKLFVRFEGDAGEICAVITDNKDETK